MASQSNLVERPELSLQERILRDQLKRARKLRWTGGASSSTRAHSSRSHDASFGEKDESRAQSLSVVAALFQANFGNGPPFSGCRTAARTCEQEQSGGISS
jgi:hypothetical protein